MFGLAEGFRIGFGFDPHEMERALERVAASLGAAG
jgi:hypothetical protein